MRLLQPVQLQGTSWKWRCMGQFYLVAMTSVFRLLPPWGETALCTVLVRRHFRAKPGRAATEVECIPAKCNAGRHTFLLQLFLRSSLMSLLKTEVCLTPGVFNQRVPLLALLLLPCHQHFCRWHAAGILANRPQGWPPPPMVPDRSLGDPSPPLIWPPGDSCLLKQLLGLQCPKKVENPCLTPSDTMHNQTRKGCGNSMCCYNSCFLN